MDFSLDFVLCLSCNGDSGAPLIMARRKGSYRPYLVGITSGGIAGGCDPFLPVIYTGVDTYRDWINHTIQCYTDKIPKSAADLTKRVTDESKFIDSSLAATIYSNLLTYSVY